MSYMETRRKLSQLGMKSSRLFYALNHRRMACCLFALLILLVPEQLFAQSKEQPLKRKPQVSKPKMATPTTKAGSTKKSVLFRAGAQKDSPLIPITVEISKPAPVLPAE